jgi:hypothetical protein
MNKIIWGILASTFVFSGWLLYKTHEMDREQVCHDLDYKMACAQSWQVHKLSCENGAIYSNEFFLLLNQHIDWECPTIPEEPSRPGEPESQDTPVH